MLPQELVLVRHGESEGNVASNLMKKGDRSLGFILTDHHTARWRLTPKGVEQAKMAGEWLRANLQPLPSGDYFDRHYVSEYVRAMETASHLGLVQDWYVDYNLRERCWGELEQVHRPDWKELYAANMRMREQEPWFWKPPGGEIDGGAVPARGSGAVHAAPRVL